MSSEFTVSITDELIAQLVDLVADANALAMAHYGARGLSVSAKSDNSPVTDADLAVNHLIATRLAPLGNCSLISEESDIPAPDIRQAFTEYWLVDPLDGTKGFIAGTGDFTVNIALMRNAQPVLGVVGIPVTGEIFVGINEPSRQQSWKYTQDAVRSITCETWDARKAQGAPLRQWVSKRHGSSRLSQWVALLSAEWGAVEQCEAGSSLKFCRLAENAGDLYVRFGPTSEWDVAAGQAVLAGAGGCVMAIAREGRLLPFPYNKASLLNGPFCAFIDTSLARSLLETCLKKFVVDANLG